MIRPNVCPYCDGRYMIAFGGCENKCRDSQRVAEMIRAAIEEDERRAPCDER